MWAGVVPQQPPTTVAPASRKRRAQVAMYSGVHRYTYRPSTRAAEPAFGIAESFAVRAAAAMRWSVSIMAWGPWLQLAPIIGTPRASSSRMTSSGVSP